MVEMDNERQRQYHEITREFAPAQQLSPSRGDGVCNCIRSNVEVF